MADLAGREILFWGFKILVKFFLGGDGAYYRPSSHCEIIREADGLAGSGRGLIGEEVLDDRLRLPSLEGKEPLQSIFPEVFLNRRPREDEDTVRLASNRYYLRPGVLLGDGIVYPSRNGAPIGGGELSDSFRRDLDAFGVGDVSKQSAESFDENLCLFLLEKYGASLPSGVDECISLYEHIKTTAALASCLCSGVSEAPFLLVAGDLSGIQDFVYGISGGGALKSLRARSFLLEFLLEHTVSEILETCNLSKANAIYAGGGNFYLILPNEKRSVDALESVKDAVNRWLLEEFEGRVYLGMAWIPFSKEELRADSSGGEYGEFWERAGQQLEEDKHRRFFNLLKSDRGDGENILLGRIEPQQKTNEDECQICHRDDLPEDEGDVPVERRGIRRLFKDSPISPRVCDHCYNLFRIGDDLTGFRYVVRRSTRPSDVEKGFLELPRSHGTSVFYTLERGLPEGAEKVWFNPIAWDIEDGRRVLRSHTPLLAEDPLTRRDFIEKMGFPTPFLVESYAIRYGDIKDVYPGAEEAERQAYAELSGRTDVEPRENSSGTLDGLARTAIGAKKIAALRMDVDNLGLIFSQGLQGRFRSIAHSATLSRDLSYFFKYYLNFICEGDITKVNPGNTLQVGGQGIPLRLDKRRLEEGRRRMVSVIYSGGDDLFIVGAWSDVVELAYDIRQCFKRYTCSLDEDMTCSYRFLSICGGVTLHHPKYPLYLMASASEEALSAAKGVDPIECTETACCISFETCALYDEMRGACGKKDAVSLLYSKRLAVKAQKLEDELAGTTYPPDRIKVTLSCDDSTEYTVEAVERLTQLGAFTDDHFELAIPRAFLRKLIRASKKWQADGAIYIPFLEWTYGKTDEAISGAPGQVREKYEYLKENLLVKLAAVGEEIKSVHIPLAWVELLIRETE